MDQKCLPSWRNPARYPTSPDADVFVHASHLMGGVHQRGGRRAAHRAAHRGAVGPERSGRSILKITSLCRCAGPQEAAFCVLRAMRHRGCYGTSNGPRGRKCRGTFLAPRPHVVYPSVLWKPQRGFRRDGKKGAYHAAILGTSCAARAACGGASTERSKPSTARTRRQL